MESFIRLDDKLWFRKDTHECLEVTMGCNIWAHLVNLIGIYILHELANQFPDIKACLYRDISLLYL